MSATSFLSAIQGVTTRIHETQLDNIKAAASAIASSIAADRMVHLFGAGHSAIPVMEAFPRIGGIVGFHSIIELPLSFNGQVVGQMGMRQSSFLEKQSGYAEVILGNYALDERDSMIIFSHSGINALPVEMAVEGQKRGLTVIAALSVEHCNAHEIRHPAGRLSDNADVVIDNCVPEGDALVDIPNLAYKVASGSTIAHCIIVDAIVAETAQQLMDRGIEPVVYPNHNVGLDADSEARLVAQEMRVLDEYKAMKKRV